MKKFKVLGFTPELNTLVGESGDDALDFSLKGIAFDLLGEIITEGEGTDVNGDPMLYCDTGETFSRIFFVLEEF